MGPVSASLPSSTQCSPSCSVSSTPALPSLSTYLASLHTSTCLTTTSTPSPPSPPSPVWVTSCLPRQTCLPGWSQTVKHSTISVVPRKVGSPARRPAGITTTVLDLACSSASPSVLEAPSTRLPPGSASLRTR